MFEIVWTTTPSNNNSGDKIVGWIEAAPKKEREEEGK